MFVGCRIPIKSQVLTCKTRPFSATVALLSYPYGHRYALTLFDGASFIRTVSASSPFIKTTARGSSTLNLVVEDLPFVVVEDLPFGLTEGLARHIPLIGK